LVSQLSGDLLDPELSSIERDRATGALALQLSMERGRGEPMISLPSHTDLPVDTAITKSRPPGFTTEPSSTLLLGPKCITACFSILSSASERSSNASDRSLASSACACSSSSIGLLLSSRAIPTVHGHRSGSHFQFDEVGVLDRDAVNRAHDFRTASDKLKNGV
jgi:hypothetical protein